MVEQVSTEISYGDKYGVKKGGSSSGSSGTKRRLQRMAAADKKIVHAFVFVFLLSAALTLGTIVHLESHFYDSSNPILEGMSHKLEANNYLPIHNRKKVPPPPPPPRPNKNLQLHEIKDIETLQHTFPINAGKDLEEIDHPGIFFADEDQFQLVLYSHPNLPKDGKIMAPKFWTPVAYGEKGVRHFLGENGRRLITPDEAKQVGSFYNDMETIYISIASYRDPECQLTVEDIFLRADHPERLRVAIIDQRAENDSVPPCNQPRRPCDEDPEQVMCKYKDLIEAFEILSHLSVGPVFARHLANRMYRGEYFAMQIDAHVRFIEHWDTSIIGQWRSAKNEMAVLSVYLSDIINSIDPVTHENKHPGRPIMCQTNYEGRGKMKHLRHGQQPEGLPGIHGEPTLHPFWAAGFSFGKMNFVPG